MFKYIILSYGKGSPFNVGKVNDSYLVSDTYITDFLLCTLHRRNGLHPIPIAPGLRSWNRSDHILSSDRAHYLCGFRSVIIFYVQRREKREQAESGLTTPVRNLHKGSNGQVPGSCVQAEQLHQLYSMCSGSSIHSLTHPASGHWAQKLELSPRPWLESPALSLVPSHSPSV